MYFTDRGIDELAARRGQEEVSFAWLADRLREFVAFQPSFADPVDLFARWLARLDENQ